MVFISSLKYWIWLSSFSGVGPASAAALIRHFGAPEEVFAAGADDYIDVEGITKADISKLLNKDPGAADQVLADCAQIGCRVLTLSDEDYPDMLRNIYDPPIVLYVRGSLPAVDEEPTIAVVGTRDCTPYGRKAADNIGYHLALHGFIVATGLARGIDTFVAGGALRAGGRVIGVVGSGVNIVYPPENKSLFNDVSASGAIISEYPPGSEAVPWHFPARNRILSGISLGVAVIEAPKKSGALITAARALEQGRDVFALPGNVDAQKSEGSNMLLREGAIPILSGADIVDEYADLFPDIGKKEIDNTHAVEYIDLDKIAGALDGDEKTVALTIGHKTMIADEIIAHSGMPAQQVLTALTMLEIKGCVIREHSMYKLSNI